MNSARKGYTSVRLGVRARLKEMATLLAIYRHDREKLVAKAISEMSAALFEIETILGKPVANLDILEIGSGQKSLQLALLCSDNRAIGIDQESSGQALSVRGVLLTTKNDGVVRAMKTVVRKVMGIDNAIKNEFAKQTRISSFPELNIVKMDAEQMTFQDNSFDLIYSRAVFEHLSNPEKVLSEVSRVLRPGGVFYCLLHLYTSDSGCHDARIFANRRSELPYWSHLRHDCRDKVFENTYLNRFRLEKWREVLTSKLPRVNIYALKDDHCAERISELVEMRKNGELVDYTDEELLTVTVKVVWKC